MIRFLLHSQLIIFFFAGLVGGAALSVVIEYKCQKAAGEATATVYMGLPMKALGEISI